MTELPAVVQVGPMRYSVVADKAKCDAEAVDTGRRVMGYSDHSALEIAVKAGMARDQEADTVLHEVLHCCLRQSDGELGNEVEERVVGSLSPLLLDTLRRNPALVAYLTAEGEGA